MRKARSTRGDRSRCLWPSRTNVVRGLMTEAVQPVLGFAFEDLGFDRLVLTNAVGNERSRRIKEKTGARLIDIRPAKFVEPSYSAHEIWELNKSEWIPGEPSVVVANDRSNQG
jgi:ribosomal-protein-alanine N-acetyltransferase